MNRQNFGQWIGHTIPDDAPPHLSILNVEARRPEVGQVIGIAPYGESKLRTLTYATIKANGDKSTGEFFDFRIFDQEKERVVPLLEFWKKLDWPGEPPSKGTYESITDGDRSYGTYKNNLGKGGRFEIYRRETVIEGINPPVTWKEFKRRIDELRGARGYVYRGQSNSNWPLRTLFHRRGRNDLIRFVEEDFPQLRHNINAVSKHYYHEHGEDFLALLSLAQHHCYPTPLLDWTRSPYVAAFFAFDGFSCSERWDLNELPKSVRVFLFDETRWGKSNPSSLRDPMPQFRFEQPPAHNNPRFLPQQSVSCFSNVVSIEELVASVEREHKLSILTAIDIDSREREIAIADLRLMGVTPASLFPGFEGICRSLRSEDFR